MPDFGQRLRAARTAAGLTREVLAVRAGLTVGTIANYETGATQPQVDRLEALAGALGRSVDDLLQTVPAPTEDRNSKFPQ